MNRQITLAARPKGFPKDTDFKLVEAPLPEAGAGEFLVQALYLSVDPYMRGRMNDAKSYAEPVGIGDVMVGESVGRVIQSKNDRFPEGTYVAGMFGWQEYAVSDGKMVRRLNPAAAPISTALHVLGMPGMTAYFGLFDVCQAREGETVVVSAAAGAVGSVVGQLAKLTGCRVVGVAGSDEKIQFITDELGLDAGMNYKTTDDYVAKLRQLCPQGIDAYFDNVGGPLTDAVFPLLNVGARICICGQISQYNVDSEQQGPRLLWHLIVKRATVRGMLVMDYADRFREALEKLTDWFQAGKLKYRERITDGIDNAPCAFLEMMQGANIGKQLVKVSEE
jgi:NADPH-dependent curcumin reductase CurA